MSADLDPPDLRSDAELLTAARNGDPAAFGVLYRRYRDWAVRLARRSCATDADALDVLQDAFVYVLDKLPRLELRARFTTFLFPVIRNLARNRLRRNRREASLEVAAEPASGAEAPASLDDLAHALGALPEAQRSVVLLRFVDELTLEEIRAQIGIPLGTVKSRLHQALCTLREDPRTRRYFLGEP